MYDEPLAGQMVPQHAKLTRTLIIAEAKTLLSEIFPLREDNCVMARKRAFISFDYDHDKDLPGSLVSQAKRSESPFNVTDWSLKEPVNEKWKQEARALIRKADLIIVICGEHTHDAAGVAAEVTIVHEEKSRTSC